MSRRWDTLNLWPQGSRNTTAGSPTHAQLGEYAQAIMVVHVSAISGSLVPRWQVYDGSRYVNLVKGATCTATEPSATIRAYCGNQGRPHWTISGAGAHATAGFSIIAKT
jgi:hypothetical protein